ncbi:MAG: sodium:solute symporter [Flavobacteriales bacterium]
MSSSTILLILCIYFGVLLLIAWYTSRGSNNESFFIGNRKSHWFLVAFGMIGTSISGVTFISIPGQVGTAQFAYMQVALGYLAGYFIIAYVLMPLYYRHNLVSIYSYLGTRLGKTSHYTGAGIFLASRLVGSCLRLLLVARVLQQFVFEDLGIDFQFSLIFSMLLIWFYTNRGGVKTIVITDTIQTAFLVGALILTLISIASHMNLGVGDMITTVSDSAYSQAFFFDDWLAKNHFVKQFLGGMFICLAMTGLDQDLMQKNLSCKNIKEAQKNMVVFSLIILVVNFLFVTLGALLYIYANKEGVTYTGHPDSFYPTLAVGGHFSSLAALFFVLGITAAAFASGDSAITSLTTSVCIDFLDIEKKEKAKQERIRKITHIITCVVAYVTIVILHYTTTEDAISVILFAATITYGPLIGLFFFGILTKRQTTEWAVPVISIVVPYFCFELSRHSADWLGGYVFSWELLGLNGLLVFALLWITGKKQVQPAL